MRTTILATLALTSSMVHAQATTPAKTADTVLLSRVSAPASPATDKAHNAPAASDVSFRVSTGIKPPTLLQQAVEIAPAGIWRPRVIGDTMTVVVNFTVDATGKPVNLSIAQSAGPLADQDTLAAVSKYHYQPGTLDGQAIDVPVTLKVVLERGARY